MSVLTATRDQRRRKREREKAAKSDAPTQRDVDRAIRERMRRDMIEAERRLGSMAMLSPLWWRE